MFLIYVASLEILKDTSSIVFHTSSLNIRDVSIKADSLKEEQAPVSQSFDAAPERMTLQFPTSFPAGSKAQLKVTYDAQLTGNMMGYYYSTWEKEGRKQYYTLTQFEVRCFLYFIYDVNDNFIP